MFALFSEFKNSAEKDISPQIMVMTYARYCRYRCMLRRLEKCEDKWLRHALVTAIGGFAATKENNRVYFCRDIFEHADLDDFELRCDHLGTLYISISYVICCSPFLYIYRLHNYLSCVEFWNYISTLDAKLAFF